MSVKDPIMIVDGGRNACGCPTVHLTGAKSA
jgi:hypothetical protein